MVPGKRLPGIPDFEQAVEMIIFDDLCIKQISLLSVPVLQGSHMH